VTTAYTVAVEFAVVPATIFYVLYRWQNALAGAFGVVALLVVPLIPFVEPAATYSGYWMYAYSIPPLLLAIGAVHDHSSKRAGIWLGVTALIELVIGGVGAVIVATAYLLKRDIAGIVRAAGWSMLIASPLIIFAVQHNRYWISTGSSRLGEFVLYPGFIKFALVAGIFGVCTLGIFYTVVTEGPFPVVGAVSLSVFVCGAFFFFNYIPSYWYKLLFGYMLRFGLALTVGSFTSSTVELVRNWHYVQKKSK